MDQNKKEADPLYFIAIVTPEPAYANLTAIKQEIATKYGAKAALKSPPHITLHMPFRWPEKKISMLNKVLKEVASTTESFDLSLNGFGAFPPRVVYVNVTENERLEELHKKLLKEIKMSLNIFNGIYKKQAFHPHLTVAFRDLKRASFEFVWKEFQNRLFSFNFKVSEVSLLKHNGKNWDVFQQFNLKATVI